MLNGKPHNLFIGISSFQFFKKEMVSSCQNISTFFLLTIRFKMIYFIFLNASQIGSRQCNIFTKTITIKSYRIPPMKQMFPKCNLSNRYFFLLKKFIINEIASYHNKKTFDHITFLYKFNCINHYF